MSFLPPSGGVVRLAPSGGPGRVFHTDGSFGSQSANRQWKQKTLHKQTGKLSLFGRPPVPFYVAIRFVLKLLRSLWMLWESSWNIYNEFSIFSCLASIPWDDIKRQPFLTPMSEFQQAAIKETENFGRTPKENPCQQILIVVWVWVLLSSLAVNVQKRTWLSQAIRLAIHFARRYLLGHAPNPMERRSSFCGCAFWRNAFLLSYK